MCPTETKASAAAAGLWDHTPTFTLSGSLAFPKGFGYCPQKIHWKES